MADLSEHMKSCYSVNNNYIISSTTMPMVTKLGRMMTLVTVGIVVLEINGFSFSRNPSRPRN